MPLKVELQMESCGQTWSESHYYLAAASVPTDTQPMNNLASYRAPCLGANAQVTGVEISDVPGNRLVETLFFPNGGKRGKFVSDEQDLRGDAVTPNNALLINMTAGGAINGPPKKLYLAGVPQATISTFGDNRDQLGDYPQFVSQLASYMAFLTGNFKPNSTSSDVQALWGYRARDNAGDVKSAGDPTAGPGPDFHIGIQTSLALPGVGTGVGQTLHVYLTGWRRKNPRLPGLSGVWQVSLIAPPIAPAAGPWTYYLQGSSRVDATNFVSIGKIGPLAYKYPAYGPYWSIERAVTRKRGESIARRRGRSPIRA
jgi:hypothetical protein